MSNTMKKSILFVSMLSISMLVWNCGGGDSSPRVSLNSGQKQAAQNLGLTVKLYEDALNSNDTKKIGEVYKIILVRTTAQNGLNMLASNVELFVNNDPAGDEAFYVALGNYLFAPANQQGGNTNSEATAATRKTYAKLAFGQNSTQEGVDRIFKKNTGAVYTHRNSQAAKDNIFVITDLFNVYLKIQGITASKLPASSNLWK